MSIMIRTRVRTIWPVVIWILVATIPTRSETFVLDAIRAIVVWIFFVTMSTFL